MTATKICLVVLFMLSFSGSLLAQGNIAADEAYQEGVRHLNARDHKKAQEPLEKALTLAPDLVYKTKVYTALVAVYRTLPESEKMVEAQEFILRHSENLTDRRTAAGSLSSFLFQRGLVETQMKRYEEIYQKNNDDYAALAMMSEMSRAAKVDKTTAEAYKQRYETAEKTLAGKFALAKEKLAENDQTQTTWLWKEAAVLWTRAGDHGRALIAAGKAEKSGPEKRNLLNHFWHAQLGDVYAAANKHAEAVEHFEKAIATTTIKGYQDTCKIKLEESKKQIAAKK